MSAVSIEFFLFFRTRRRETEVIPAYTHKVDQMISGRFLSVERDMKFISEISRAYSTVNRLNRVAKTGS